VFKKIPSRKISDEIVRQFIDLVERGILKPGDRLPSERDMARELGVSRLPLREALKALQAMGFIKVENRRKTLVLPITKTTLQDPISLVLDGNIEKVFELLEIREVLESWAAQRATEKATEEDIRALEKVVERMREDFNRGNLGDKADADFHMAIAHATHNTILSHLMATWYHLLWNCQKVSREKLFNNEENRRRLLAQHLEIFEAIRQHDKRRAGNAIRDHLLFVERELEKHLRGER